MLCVTLLSGRFSPCPAFWFVVLPWFYFIPPGLICTSLVYRASPPISMPAKRSCILRSPFIWRAWQLRCYLPVKWPIVQGESLSPSPARRYLLSLRCSVHWLKPARYFLQGAFYRGWAQAVVTWWRSPFCATRWMIDVGLKCCRYSTVLPASFRC